MTPGWGGCNGELGGGLGAMAGVMGKESSRGKRRLSHGENGPSGAPIAFICDGSNAGAWVGEKETSGRAP
jgi:hypothetical protein